MMIPLGKDIFYRMFGPIFFFISRYLNRFVFVSHFRLTSLDKGIKKYLYCRLQYGGVVINELDL